MTGHRAGYLGQHMRRQMTGSMAAYAGNILSGGHSDDGSDAATPSSVAELEKLHE
jgi:hypothetical protein